MGSELVALDQGCVILAGAHNTAPLNVVEAILHKMFLSLFG
jgi:hypothetical protein